MKDKDQLEAIPGITVIMDEQDIYNWVVKMKGPEGSPYESGILTLKVNFPNNYPHKKPNISFYPIIYHPNVTQNDGIMCIDLLMDNNWSPARPLKDVFEQIREALINPNPSHGDDGEISSLFITNREQYLENARKWTAQYAHE